MTEITAVQQAVNRYHAQGFTVIPILPGSKRPAVAWQEYQHRRPTAKELREWFGNGDMNIGIVTGPASGGLDALDVDDTSLAARIADDVGLRAETTLVRTPSGGLHAWAIETDAVSRSGPLVPGVADLKAGGGYVLAPPSTVGGREYTFLTNGTIKCVPDARAWAVGVLRAYDVMVPEPKGNGEHLDTATVLEGVPEGQRDEALFRLACKLRRADVPQDTAERLVLEAAARCAPPFSEKEALKCLRSAYQRYQPAREDDRQPIPRPYKGLGVGLTLPVVSLETLRQRHSGEIEWIVPGYMARGEVGFLAGAGESFKSWAAAHLAAAIDGGFKWLGVFEVKATRGLYVEQERAANLVYQLNRIEAGESIGLGSERLQIVPPCPLPLSEPEAQAALESVIIAHKPDVVIINALRDVLGRANENSPTDMAGLLGPLGRMAESHGCCILIIDHFNKAGMHGLVRGTAAHGGTAHKYNEADYVLIAERPRDEVGKGTGPATVSIAKRRTGEPGPTFAVDVAEGPQGVLVRATAGVKALSPLAQAVRHVLEQGPALVNDLCTRTGKDNKGVHNALSELKAAGLVEGQGEKGKAHVYRLTGAPTPRPYKGMGVGPGGDAYGLKPTDGHLVRFAVEQLGLRIIGRKPAPDPRPPIPDACPACGGDDWYFGENGDGPLCERCHPIPWKVGTPS